MEQTTPFASKINGTLWQGLYFDYNLEAEVIA
jgi:hypothetical protein